MAISVIGEDESEGQSPDFGLEDSKQLATKEHHLGTIASFPLSG